MEQRLVDLKAHFEAAARVMSELPIFNPALAVEAVAFQPIEQGLLGVMITPWCMNLVFLPEQEDVPASSVGSKRMIRLPSGQYEFIQGHIEGLGCYLSCSLFSPMSEFSSHALAVETAHEVMQALFNDEHYSPTERQAPAEPPAVEDTLPKDACENVNEPQLMSRRRFLSGALSER